MSASVLGAISAILIFVFIIVLLRRGLLKEKYAVLWLLFAGVTVVMALVPGALEWVSDLLGVEIPSNLIFFATITLLILVSIQMNYELSRHEARLRRLAEEVALLRQRLEGRDGDGNS
jgi:hypothetical protein